MLAISKLIFKKMSTVRTVSKIYPTCVIGFYKIYIWSSKDAIFLTVRDKNCIYLFGMLFMSVLSFALKSRSVRFESLPAHWGTLC